MDEKKSLKLIKALKMRKLKLDIFNIFKIFNKYRSTGNICQKIMFTIIKGLANKHN